MRLGKAKQIQGDYSVEALDNLSAGKLQNVQHLKYGKKFIPGKADLKSAQTVDKSVTDIDVVFHPAAHANSWHWIASPHVLLYARDSI